MCYRFLLIVLCLVGCSKEKSEDLTAKDIFMAINVVQNSKGEASVNVEMRKENVLGIGVELSSNESLIALFGGKEFPLKKDEDLLRVEYYAFIPVFDATSEIAVRLGRANGSSIETKIALLPSFVLHYPTLGSEYRNDESIDVSWSPEVSGGSMNIHGYLACYTIDKELDVDLETENEEWSFPDTGNYSFTADVLIKSLERELIFEDEERIMKSEKCIMEVDLFRENSRFISDVYAQSSYIKVKQLRSVKGMEITFD